MVLSVKCIFSDGQQQHHLILLIPHWTPSLSHHAGSHGIFWVVNKRCQKQQRHYSPVTVRHMLRAIVPTSSAQLSKPVKSLLQCPVYSGKVGSYITNCWTVLDIKKWVIFEFFSKFILNDTQCFNMQVKLWFGSFFSSLWGTGHQRWGWVWRVAVFRFKRLKTRV